MANDQNLWGFNNILLVMGAGELKPCRKIDTAWGKYLMTIPLCFTQQICY
jgi:hypothetical protein